MKVINILALGLCALSAACAADQNGIELKPFTIDHRAAERSSLDLSFLLDAPAGKDGPIRVAGGHFVKPDGKRFRIWGVNITSFAPGSIHFPAKEDAAFWADTLARFGVNCVRLHSFDVPAPKGIIAAGRNDTREFDAEQLDRMDYFVYALKKRGIYVNLNLNVGRTYKPGDGVRDFELIGYAKAVTYFDPRLVELQKEYARKLLTHYNPYTKSEYRNEPAVAIIEILNENSLVGTWVRGRLSGTKVSGRPENWQDIPPYYERQLTQLYNQWLASRFSAAELADFRTLAKVGPGEAVPRLKPAEFEGAPRKRFETEASFYMEVESNFFSDMRSYLKQTLGAKPLLTGTSDFSYGKSFYGSLVSNSMLDIIDTHGPWELSAIVDEPANSIPVRLSRSAMAGKPFTVSEHNHRFPSDHISEGIPILAAYASFQDWDGIFLYTFEPKPPGYKPFNETRADLSHDPVKLANLAAGALMFLRTDITPARETVERSYSRQQIYDSMLLPGSAAGVYFTPGFPSSVALRHGSRISSLNGATTKPLTLSDASPIVSDTKELAWYYAPRAQSTTEDDQKFTSVSRPGGRKAHSGVVTVDTARTQALIGFLNTQNRSVTHLSADIANTFATLVLSSLDSKPLSQSSKMLLAATSGVTNTGAEWNASRTALAKWGGTPTLIEPVTGKIVLRDLHRASAVYVSPLNGAGTPVGPRIPATRVSEGWEIGLGSAVTTWYEITVERR